MSDSEGRVRGTGRRIQGAVTRVLVGLLVLVIFGGMGLLVYNGQLSGESLVFFSGVIVGYLARMGTDVF